MEVNYNDQGSAYFKKGRMYSKNKEYKKAITAYEKALPFFEKSGDKGKLGNLYLEKGVAHHEMRDLTGALEMYEKARVFYEQVGDESVLSELDIFKAMIYRDRDENLKARELLEKGLRFYEKSGNAAGIANTAAIMGDVLLKLGETARALVMAEKALTLYEEVGNKPVQGQLYSSMGWNYFFSGDFLRAMEMYEKALVYLDAGKYPEEVGRVYHRMGDVYLYQSNIYLALDVYEKALVHFERASSYEGLCEVYRSKGYVFSIIGAPSRALEMYDKSLSFCEKGGSLPAYRLAAYLGKAIVYCDSEDYPAAAKMYDEAYSLLEQVDSPWGEGWIYLGKARVFIAISDFDKAEDMCKKALTIFEKLGYPQAYSHVYESLGDIFLSQNNWAKAREIYDCALTVLIELGDIESLASVKLKKAGALLMLGEKTEGFSLLDDSFRQLEKFRSQAAFPEMKLSLIEDVYKRYELVFNIIMHYGGYERAFKYAELLKARLFLDQLGESLVKPEKGISPELLKERDNLTAALSLLTKKMYETVDANKLNDIKQEYHKTERKYEDLMVKIRLNNPLYASVRYPQPVTTRELQRDVLQQGEILLRYLAAGDVIYAFLVTTTDFNAITLEVKTKDLAKIINRYLFFVKKNNRGKMITYGRKLYLSIFKPVEALLQGATDIIIAPDGLLAAIPFDSFVTGIKNDNQPLYLLEKYRIKYIRSASALALLRKYYRRNRPAKRFVGFGDPVYDYGNFQQGKPEKGVTLPGLEDFLKEIHLMKYGREGGDLDRLKASGEEVTVIAGVFRKYGREAVVYLREEAVEEKVKAPGMREFDYIHFACHGILGDGFQCLVLSQVPGSGEDGFLTLNDIMNCDFNAKLVVLSACRTALGEMGRAEGVTGLTGAVMYAGTPAVVASLWNVSDAGSKELMVKFYTNLLTKEMSNEEALRQAKLDMIKSSPYSSPYFWSAFVMYGE